MTRKQVVKKYVGAACSLDGKSAVIFGRRLPYARVYRSVDGKEIECSRATVAKIMGEGGKFTTGVLADAWYTRLPDTSWGLHTKDRNCKTGDVVCVHRTTIRDRQEVLGKHVLVGNGYDLWEIVK